MKKDNLEKLREKVNTVDNQLLSLIKKRIELVREIGVLKTREKLPVKDRKRETEILEKLVKEGERLGVDKNLIIKVWKILFGISYRIER